MLMQANWWLLLFLPVILILQNRDQIIHHVHRHMRPDGREDVPPILVNAARQPSYIKE